jgi:hypothetical protein
MNSLGIGEGSDVTSTPSTVPDAPEISIDSHADSEISFYWSVPDAHGSSLFGYNLYKSTDGESFSLFNDVNPSVNSYTDTELTNGTTYYYKVTAVNDNGESNFSNVISEYPSKAPEVAGGVHLSYENYPGSLLLQWNFQTENVYQNNGDIVTAFNIYDASTNALVVNAPLSGSGGFQYPLSTINGKTCSFIITVVNRDGESAGVETNTANSFGLPDPVDGLTTSDSNSSSYGQEITISWNYLIKSC